MIQVKLSCHIDIQKVKLATHNGLSGFYSNELAITESSTKLTKDSISSSSVLEQRKQKVMNNIGKGDI